MKRPGPVAQMTIAITSFFAMTVIMGDMFLNVLSDPEKTHVQMRAQIGDTAAAQVAALLGSGDKRSLQLTFDTLVTRNNDVRSVAIRQANGDLLMQAGAHRLNWSRNATRSSSNQYEVPLRANDQAWGNFEISFVPSTSSRIISWLMHPLMQILAVVWLVGAPVLYLYLRRALQHLDPSSVIPERVQGAFDAMSEGVVVVDTRCRILLASSPFRRLCPPGQTIRPGAYLSTLPWLEASLPQETSEHPWSRAVAEGQSNSGTTIIIQTNDTERQLTINCAPIFDPGGKIRGCLTTFDDISQLHKSHNALRASMAALSESKKEIQRQNVELHRLATRDPMTGCLNRRALFEMLEKIYKRVHEDGTPVSCFMVDIDFFKKVNDNYGHAIGDRVIQEVAKKLYESVRSTDLVCRYGGEEFCLILPGMELNVARKFAERIRAKVEQHSGMSVREVDGLKVTVSVGIHTLHGSAVDGQQLIDRADEALYTAKRTGRNKVCAYQPTALLASQTEPAGTVT